MGKGDKKSRRGKISIGSFGVRRPRRVKKEIIIAKKADKAKPKKVAEHKPAKVVAEEPVVVVEPMVVKEPAIVKEHVAKAVGQAELQLDVKPAKAPVKKAARKKPAATEKPEKAEEGEAKPKVVKAKKKAASTDEEKPSGE